MNMPSLLKASLSILALGVASTSFAGAVNIAGTDGAEIQKTVIGVYSSNEKVHFNSAGSYSIVLTDFGSTDKQFGQQFNYLGAMVSSSYDNIGSAELNKYSTGAHDFYSFDITEAGDYWLSMFAITNSDSNAGTFNMSIVQGDVNPVPLPASFWLMATSLLGLASFARQNRANNKDAVAA